MSGLTTHEGVSPTFVAPAIYRQVNEPESPNLGDLWEDMSVDPPTLKNYTASGWQLVNGPSGGVTPKRSVGITFDGGGSPPTVGSVGYVIGQFNGTIDQWAIVADTAGSAVVDVWKAANSIPTVANTITGSEKPTLVAQQLNRDLVLSTWTTAVLAGDVFGFKLESVTTCNRVTCEVRVAESA